MISKIKEWFKSKWRPYKMIKFLSERYAAFRKENYDLKGMLMNRRKKINDLEANLLKTVNDLNLLGDKKKRGEKMIAELIKRRDEFLVRITDKAYIDISSMADYKYFLSEPFIVDRFEPYKLDENAIDGFSAVKGLGEIFKKIDEKQDKKVDEFTTP